MVKHSMAYPDIIIKHYNPMDCRTWPFFPIIMPLKDGMGPASDEDCDEITWEVWDRICDTYGRFKCLPDAINHAMKLNKEFIDGETAKTQTQG